MESKKDVVAIATVPDALRVIKEKINKLKYIQESSYKTSGKVPSIPTNLKDMKTVEEVVTLLSAVQARNEAYEKAAETLNIRKKLAFKIDGAILEDWVTDCKFRIDVITYEVKYNELKSIEKEYIELMDKNDRMALLNDKVNKIAAED